MPTTESLQAVSPEMGPVSPGADFPKSDVPRSGSPRPASRIPFVAAAIVAAGWLGFLAFAAWKHAFSGLPW